MDREKEMEEGRKKAGEREDFPGGTVAKNLPASAGEADLILGLGRLHVPQCS